MSEKKAATDKDDVFHFISYIPHNGKVYELDGIYEGPILLGEITETKSWLDIAKEEINKRIQHYASNEIRFALQAVIKSKKGIAEQLKVQLNSSFHSHLRKLKEIQGEGFNIEAYGDVDEGKISSMDVEINLDEEKLVNELTRIKSEMTSND